MESSTAPEWRGRTLRSLSGREMRLTSDGLVSLLRGYLSGATGALVTVELSGYVAEHFRAAHLRAYASNSA